MSSSPIMDDVDTQLEFSFVQDELRWYLSPNAAIVMRERDGILSPLDEGGELYEEIEISPRVAFSISVGDWVAVGPDGKLVKYGTTVDGGLLPRVGAVISLLHRVQGGRQVEFVSVAKYRKYDHVGRDDGPLTMEEFVWTIPS